MYNLFIDESGKPHLKSTIANQQQPYFSLAGVIVHDHTKQALKIKADQIKFKYWGNTDVVFHANDIRMRTGDFSIFNQSNSKFTISDFYSDFINLLNGSYKIGVVCINKNNYINQNPPVSNALNQYIKTRAKGWKVMIDGVEKDLMEKASTQLLNMYLYYLNTKKEMPGEVIMESSDRIQDIEIYSSYNKLLTRGFAPFAMSAFDVRKKLTGISFVTKNNHDIESQLADIAAHYMNIEAKIMDSILKNYPSPTDAQIINVLKGKTFLFNGSNGTKRVNSFVKLF